MRRGPVSIWEQRARITDDDVGRHGRRRRRRPHRLLSPLSRAPHATQRRAARHRQRAHAAVGRVWHVWHHAETVRRRRRQASAATATGHKTDPCVPQPPARSLAAPPEGGRAGCRPNGGGWEARTAGGRRRRRRGGGNTGTRESGAPAEKEEAVAIPARCVAGQKARPPGVTRGRCDERAGTRSDRGRRQRSASAEGGDVGEGCRIVPWRYLPHGGGGGSGRGFVHRDANYCG